MASPTRGESQFSPSLCPVHRRYRWSSQSSLRSPPISPAKVFIDIENYRSRRLAYENFDIRTVDMEGNFCFGDGKFPDVEIQLFLSAITLSWCIQLWFFHHTNAERHRAPRNHHSAICNHYGWSWCWHFPAIVRNASSWFKVDALLKETNLDGWTPFSLQI